MYIHNGLGTWKEAKRYSIMYEHGIICYDEWAHLDASLWKSVNVEKLRKIVESIPYRPGASETVRMLRNMSFKLAIVSAGLTMLADKVKRELGFDHAIANEPICRDGYMTGEIIVRVDFENKGDILKHLCREENISVERCVAIGDSGSDVPLLKAAGIAIAFNPACKALEKVSDKVVRSHDLKDIVPAIREVFHRKGFPLC